MPTALCQLLVLLIRNQRTVDIDRLLPAEGMIEPRVFRCRGQVLIAANLLAGMPYVIRQNMPLTGTTSFTDAIYGTITVENEELDDMILIKSDGFPTYNFANVVDDHLMGSEFIQRSFCMSKTAGDLLILW